MMDHPTAVHQRAGMASKTYGADSFSRQLSHPITAVLVAYIDPGVAVRWEVYYHIYYNYKVYQCATP